MSEPADRDRLFAIMLAVRNALAVADNHRRQMTSEIGASQANIISEALGRAHYEAIRGASLLTPPEPLP